MQNVWKEYDDLYDICLGVTCDRFAEVSDFLQQVPVLADPAFQSRILDRSHVAGPLGLELPKDLAEQLLKRFQEVGSEGSCFPASYHHPRMALEQASRLAAQAIEASRLQRLPTETLGPLFLGMDHPVIGCLVRLQSNWPSKASYQVPCLPVLRNWTVISGRLKRFGACRPVNLSVKSLAESPI